MCNCSLCFLLVSWGQDSFGNIILITQYHLNGHKNFTDVRITPGSILRQSVLSVSRPILKPLDTSQCYSHADLSQASHLKPSFLILS